MQHDEDEGQSEENRCLLSSLVCHSSWILVVCFNRSQFSDEQISLT